MACLKHRFYNLCTIFESIYQMSRFINFILFLRVGEFRSLLIEFYKCV